MVAVGTCKPSKHSRMYRLLTYSAVDGGIYWKPNHTCMGRHLTSTATRAAEHDSESGGHDRLDTRHVSKGGLSVIAVRTIKSRKRSTESQEGVGVG